MSSGSAGSGGGQSHRSVFGMVAAGLLAGSAVGLAVWMRAAAAAGAGGGGGGGAAAAAGGATAGAAASAPATASDTTAAAPGRKTGGGRRGSSSSSSAAPSSASAASAAKLLLRLETALESLEHHALSGSDSGFDSPPHHSATSPLGKSLEKVIKEARQMKKNSWCIAKGVAIQHRIMAAKLLIKYHRSGVSRSAPELRAAADEQRKKDFERCWTILYGRAAEAEAAQPQPSETFLSLQPPTDLADPRYMPASMRQELECLLLEAALELRDLSRMWTALREMLHVQEAQTPTVAAFSAVPVVAPAAASSSPSADHAVALTLSQLLSLDETSLTVAYHVAPLLGCWLWVFQLGFRLFGARRVMRSFAATNSRWSNGVDLYERLHALALDAPASIDYAVCWEISNLRIHARLATDPQLLTRLQIARNQIAPSVLPYDEAGQPIEATNAQHTDSASSPLNSSLTSLPPLASLLSTAPSSSASLLAPLPSSSLCWEEWMILAYSTSVLSVNTPDDSLRGSLLDQLLKQDVELQDLTPMQSLGGSVVEGAGSSRSIKRQGRLFSMVGLFRHPIPTVGSIVGSEPPSPDLSRTPNGTRISMQGYTCIAPTPAAPGSAAAAAASEEASYTQFELYQFTTGPMSSSANSSHSSSSSALNSGAITNSLVDYSAAHPSSNTPSTTLPSPVRARQDSAPDSPTSAHLFASASFASLDDSATHHEHFAAGPSSQAAGAGAAAAAALAESKSAAAESSHPPSPLLSPGLSSSVSPAPTALQRFAAQRPGSELWCGRYHVIQAPMEPTPGFMNQRVTRPRIEVHYELHIVVQRVNAVTPAELQQQQQFVQQQQQQQQHQFQSAASSSSALTDSLRRSVTTAPGAMSRGVSSHDSPDSDKEEEKND